ncbi:unnamed protein product [Auanema sp. JU1783]|nr:unnamed protein product [Auanema sp. JU1783]
MAGNFWASSHHEQWMFDKAELQRFRFEDFKVFPEEEYDKFMIFWCNLIQAIALEGIPSQPKARMQVVATAMVYFKRFYIRHTFKDVDPFLMACASIFLASKVEEHGQMSMSKMMNCIPALLKRFPNINFDASSKIAGLYDAEFILVETMDCCLIVYHPYRPLLTFMADIAKDNKEDITDLEAESWKVVNDSLRTDAVFLFPPHLIAVASIILGSQFLEKEYYIKNWLPEINIDQQCLMECIELICNMYLAYNSINEKDDYKTMIEKLPRIQTAPPNMGPGQGGIHCKTQMDPKMRYAAAGDRGRVCI